MNRKIWQSKNAQINDISIIAGIVSVFVILGAMMPFVHQDFNSGQTTGSVSNDALQDNSYQLAQTTSSLSMWTVIKSVLLMFFWTFGQLPFWIDNIFVIFRVMLILIVARNVWIGGGG